MVSVAGSVRRKLVPPPGASAGVSVPEWPSTMRWQSVRPTPAPLSLVVKKGSNMRAFSAAGMPGPLSVTSAVTMPSGPAWVVTVMRASAPLSAVA